MWACPTDDERPKLGGDSGEAHPKGPTALPPLPPLPCPSQDTAQPVSHRRPQRCRPEPQTAGSRGLDRLPRPAPPT